MKLMKNKTICLNIKVHKHMTTTKQYINNL